MISRVAIVMTGGLVLACGNDASEPVKNNANTGGTAGSGGTGATAAGGTTGTGSGGTGASGAGGTGDNDGAAAAGGTAGFDGGSVTGERRACGPDVRCNAGATCFFTVTDDITNCVCDPSGHFTCFNYVLPGTPVCLPGRSCSAGGGGCSNANAFCVQNCQCQNGVLECSYDCRGSGPEQPGRLCDVSTCGRGNDSCRHEDGSCRYSVQCPSGSVSGQCD
jgi:hypothetical protein